MAKRPKKIAFVYAPARLRNPVLQSKGWGTMPPLWALYLGACLKRELPGLSLEVLDEQLLGPGGLRRRLASARYDLACFSPIFLSYADTLPYARLAKRNGALVVYGGNFATPMYREILKLRGPGSDDHCVDAVARYDGEGALAALAAGKAFSSAPNLCYKEGGAVKANPVSTPPAEEMPEPDYSLVDLEAYFARQSRWARRVVPFITQRGCRRAAEAGRCVFCSIKDAGYRTVDPETVWKRADRLVREHGVRGLYDCSADFLGGKDWFRELVAASRICRNKPVMKVALRLDDVTPAAAAALASVNVRNAILGVESFDDGILKALHKGRTCAENKRGIKLLARAGVIPEMYLLAGSPGESARTLRKTFRELASLELPRQAWELSVIHNVNMIPGSGTWHKLLKAEKKYAGLDMPDYAAMFNDWVRHFCAASPEEIKELKDSIRRLMELKARVPAGGATHDR